MQGWTYPAVSISMHSCFLHMGCMLRQQKAYPKHGSAILLTKPIRQRPSARSQAFKVSVRCWPVPLQDGCGLDMEPARHSFLQPSLHWLFFFIFCWLYPNRPILLKFRNHNYINHLHNSITILSGFKVILIQDISIFPKIVLPLLWISNEKVFCHHISSCISLHFDGSHRAPALLYGKAFLLG